MIYLVADEHFGKYPGSVLFSKIKDRFPVSLFENDWSCFEDERFLYDCDLVVLNMIAFTGAKEPPRGLAEANIRAYFELGKPALLLHGASAAFWHWPWYRSLVGYRWVRENDPDGISPSTHPILSFTVTPCKCRHPLCSELKPFSLENEELYIELEQVSPVLNLLETVTGSGTFPQCYLTVTQWGGNVIGFLPGHKPESFENPALVGTISVLIRWLLEEKKGRSDASRPAGYRCPL